ncbi:MaoC family dehydratase [Thalassiella azotivora]
MRAAGAAPAPADYVRALLPVRRGEGTLPSPTGATRVLPEAEHVATYARLCGFDVTSRLPATYPRVLAFGAQLRLMADRRFPFPPMGLVHVADEVTVHRPLPLGARVDVRVHAEAVRPHPRGRVVDLVSRVRLSRTPDDADPGDADCDEADWVERSTYLHRGPGPDATAPRPGPAPVDVPAGPVTWRLPASLGRRYASVSGDLNPIHLHALTARPFGFHRPVAHGMWTAARALAALGGHLPGSLRYEVAFGAPVLLPATVGLGVLAGDAPGRTLLQVRATGRSGGPDRVHLTGVLDAL